MLKRNGWLKRGKPPKKKRGVRRGPWRNEKKRRWVAGLPCLITGRAAQCAHVTHNGMSSKGSDEFTVPLAPEVHDQLDGRVKLPNGDYGNRVVDGTRAFERFYGVDLLERAIQLHLDWMEDQKRGNGNRDSGAAAA
jgi:hypothetical protein